MLTGGPDLIRAALWIHEFSWRSHESLFGIVSGIGYFLLSRFPMLSRWDYVASRRAEVSIVQPTLRNGGPATLGTQTYDLEPELINGWLRQKKKAHLSLGKHDAPGRSASLFSEARFSCKDKQSTFKRRATLPSHSYRLVSHWFCDRPR